MPQTTLKKIKERSSAGHGVCLAILNYLQGNKSNQGAAGKWI
jgi:hypothetical protein|tara:strand:+ start:608 stop:733 length:126 start_codon:yes stop_codon:yes gene_type:complete